jgi:hypothetical protein
MAAAKLSQTALAKKWGCSQSNIAQYVKKGMPLTSEAAADAWRDANAERKSFRTDISEDERALRLREWRIRLDKAEFELARAKEQQLPITTFEAALARTSTAFLAALNAFGPRVNEMLEGLDFNGRIDVIEREIEILRRTLATCDYLGTAEDYDGE